MDFDNRVSLALQLVAEGHERDAAFLRNLAFLGAGLSAFIINTALSIDLEVDGVVARISGWFAILASLALFLSSYFQAMWATYEAGKIHDERIRYVLGTSKQVRNIETANTYLENRESNRGTGQTFKWTARALPLSVLVLSVAALVFLVTLPLGW